MAKVQITEEYLQAIADAIREKTGETATITPLEMAEAISNITGGGGEHPEGPDFDMLVAQLVDSDHAIESGTLYSDPFTISASRKWCNSNIEASDACGVVFWNLKNITSSMFSFIQNSTKGYGVKNLYLPAIKGGMHYSPFNNVNISKFIAPYLEGSTDRVDPIFEIFGVKSKLYAPSLLYIQAASGTLPDDLLGTNIVVASLNKIGSCNIPNISVDQFNKMFAGIRNAITSSKMDMFKPTIKANDSGVLNLWLLEDSNFNNGTFCIKQNGGDVDLILRSISNFGTNAANIFGNGDGASNKCSLHSVYIHKIGSNLGAASGEIKYLVLKTSLTGQVPTLSVDAATAFTNLTAVLVPDDMVSAFKAASNWSGIADKIVGISSAGDYSDLSIPGVYEYADSVSRADRPTGVQLDRIKYVMGNNVTRLYAAGSTGTLEALSNLESVYMPNLKTLDNYAFYNTSKLIHITADSITSIARLGMYKTSALRTSYWPSLTYVASQGFSNSGLVAFNAPTLFTIDGNAFESCTKLEVFNAPTFEQWIPTSCFENDSKLKYVNIPKASGINQNSFAWCTSLKYIDFGKENLYGEGHQFNRNTSSSYPPFRFCELELFVIRNVATLTTPPVCLGPLGFDLTETGKILVPRATLNGYKTATYWSVYADKYEALEDYTVDGTVTGDIDFNKTSFYTGKQGLASEDLS